MLQRTVEVGKMEEFVRSVIRHLRRHPLAHHKPALSIGAHALRVRG
jgi:hypothetical protein